MTWHWQQRLQARCGVALLFLALVALRASAQTPPVAPTSAAPPSPATVPSGTLYNIELLIFRAAGATGGAENWGAQGGSARNIAGEESASGPSQVGHFVGALPPSAYQLGELESRLRASGGYVPLAHVAWSQTASSWGTRAGFPLQKLGISVEGLSGTIFLEHGQFLHLGMTLGYAMASPPPGLAAPAGTVFSINETRRVHYYERNYYDHPAFGVIALVTPAQGARPPGR